MGWRFYKSIRILPGVRINLNSRGVGASFGIPRTGLRYVVTSEDTRKAGRTPVGILMVVIVGLLLIIGGLLYSQWKHANPPKQRAQRHAATSTF
jgi:hypothetical protein